MSNLLKYVEHLLHDDSALQTFIVDPITQAENSFGLSKAERAVLRRTVANLANTSVNGFSMARSLLSYRRSLRLLQNVLHTSSGDLMGQMLTNRPALAAGASSSSTYFNLFVYYPNVTTAGVTDFTCKSNAAVNAFGGPYANSQGFHIVFGDGSTTVERLVLGASQAFPSIFSYETVSENGATFLSQLTINNRTIRADLSNSCYDLSKNPEANSVFWFYTVNGKPGAGGQSGSAGQSYSSLPLNSGDTVFLQLIAPDQSYGFQPCAPHELNAYALKP
jgi:hypothetical protein